MNPSKAFILLCAVTLACFIPGIRVSAQEPLQGRVQEIHEAYPPKGQAVTDLEIYSRISARLNAEAPEALVAYTCHL